MAHVEGRDTDLLVCSFRSGHKSIGNESRSVSDAFNNGVNSFIGRKRHFGDLNLCEDLLIRLLRHLWRQIGRKLYDMNRRE